MATERILSSVTGERMVILEDTPGVLRFELHSPPRQPPPPMAAHPTQEERFQVLEGRLRATIGGSTRVYGEGESLIIPAGTFHRVRNVEARPARALVEFSPADGILAFFTDLMGLTGMSPLGIARIIKRHPAAVQLAAPYAQLARLLGLLVRG